MTGELEDQNNDESLYFSLRAGPLLLSILKVRGRNQWFDLTIWEKHEKQFLEIKRTLVFIISEGWNLVLGRDKSVDADDSKTEMSRFLLF